MKYVVLIILNLLMCSSCLANLSPQDFVATAYTSAEDECGKPFNHPAYGVTASGEMVRDGFIAVDTRVIPMHSVVLVQGAGRFDGIYIAKDTGGAIEGNRIDIYVPDKATAYDFGRKRIKLTILRRGKYMLKRRFYAHKDFLDVTLPERKTKGSAGYDFYLAESIVIPAHGTFLAHSGVCVEMLEDDVLLMAARSSLYKRGLMLANGIGIIDSDFNLEIRYPLYNFTDKEVKLLKGERVCQGVFTKYHTLGEIVGATRNGGIGSTEK